MLKTSLSMEHISSGRLTDYSSALVDPPEELHIRLWLILTPLSPLRIPRTSRCRSPNSRLEADSVGQSANVGIFMAKPEGDRVGGRRTSNTDGFRTPASTACRCVAAWRVRYVLDALLRGRSEDTERLNPLRRWELPLLLDGDRYALTNMQAQPCQIQAFSDCKHRSTRRYTTLDGNCFASMRGAFLVAPRVAFTALVLKARIMHMSYMRTITFFLGCPALHRPTTRVLLTFLSACHAQHAQSPRRSSAAITRAGWHGL